MVKSMTEAVAAMAKEKGAGAVMALLILLGGIMEFSGPQTNKISVNSERLAKLEQQIKNNEVDIRDIVADVDATAANVYDIAISQASVEAAVNSLADNVQRVLDRIESNVDR